MKPSTFSHLTGVSWVKGPGKWKASCKGKHLGLHATEEGAAAAYDKYVKDGVVPVKRPTSSHLKGVSWDKLAGKWRARSEGKHLGHHATEEAAVRACDQYVNHGVEHVKHPGTKALKVKREGTSEFQGVSWDKHRGKWKASCSRKHFGYHATEEAAARAYNVEAQRIGRVDLNFVAPASDGEDDGSGSNTAAADNEEPADLPLAATPAGGVYTTASAVPGKRKVTVFRIQWPSMKDEGGGGGGGGSGGGDGGRGSGSGGGGGGSGGGGDQGGSSGAQGSQGAAKVKGFNKRGATATPAARRTKQKRLDSLAGAAAAAAGDAGGAGARAAAAASVLDTLAVAAAGGKRKRAGAAAMTLTVGDAGCDEGGGGSGAAGTGAAGTGAAGTAVARAAADTQGPTPEVLCNKVTKAQAEVAELRAKAAVISAALAEAQLAVHAAEQEAAAERTAARAT